MKTYILYWVAWAILASFPLNPLKSQILTVFSAGRQLVEKAAEESKQKRKSKVAERYTVYDTVENTLVPIMRVPTDKIKSDAKNLIVSVQATLDFARGNLKSGKHVGNMDETIQNIRFIDYKDADWVTSYYNSESGFYRSYEEKLVAKEKALKLERKQFIADSLRNDQIMHEIRFQEHLKFTRDSAITAKKDRQEQFYLSEKMRSDSMQISIKPNVITPQPYSVPPKSSKRSSSKSEYITGPRGGCYYINGNGKKVYVDHSYCQ